MKQIIVIRNDLNMRKGKMVAQGAHASVSAVLKLLGSKEVATWLNEGMTKITVKVESEQELLDVYKAAKEKGLPAQLIKDAGKTEFKGVPTLTALAIGPADNDAIDKVTGNLKLL